MTIFVISSERRNLSGTLLSGDLCVLCGQISFYSGSGVATLRLCGECSSYRPTEGGSADFS
jgi:hypothetical protein